MKRTVGTLEVHDCPTVGHRRCKWCSNKKGATPVYVPEESMHRHLKEVHPESYQRAMQRVFQNPVVARTFTPEGKE